MELIDYSLLPAQRTLLSQQLKFLILGSADGEWKTRHIRASEREEMRGQALRAKFNVTIDPSDLREQYRTLCVTAEKGVTVEFLLEILPEVAESLGLRPFMAQEGKTVKLRIRSDEFETILRPQRDAYREGRAV